MHFILGTGRIRHLFALAGAFAVAGGCSSSHPTSAPGGSGGSGGAVCGNGTCEIGETCETCPGDCGPCACMPDCSGMECGTDPNCNVSCGECSAGHACQDGQCQCVPQCDFRQCGLDPRCGVSCGDCGAGETCEGSQCVCAPDCAGRECGADPRCGVSCGDCAAGATCNDGTCVAPVACTSCSGSSGCGAGQVCGQRYCDGLSGCYGTGAGAVCDTIGGTPCPPLAMYSACSTNADCGGGPYFCFQGFCTAVCAGSTSGPNHPCAPANPQTASGVTATCASYASLCPFCEMGSDGWSPPSYCALACTSASQCPQGTTCTSGYCQ